jgi:MYXO-CTERM domain-containing protein
MRTKAVIAGLLLASILPAEAHAQQKQPYLFDVNLAAKPAEVQSMVADYAQGLPGLPLPRMTETGLPGPVSLWHYHEATHFLDRLVQTNKQEHVWPRDLDSCAAHGAFEMIQILPGGASAQCQSARDSIAAAVANRSACQEAAEPERYVLTYPPGVVNDNNTNSVLDLIGIMGSTFAQFPPLYDGVLPGDFAEDLRDVLRKLRREELINPLDGQIQSFSLALDLLEKDSDCFLPEARVELQNEIERLKLEASSQRDRIQTLVFQGEAEYRREKLRLSALSRSRHDLPYPSLTQADREFLAFWIGALYWRLRGGGIILLGGTQECRRLGLRRPFNVIGDLAGRSDGTEAADGIYCEIFSGWGEWFDMGTTPGQEDKYYDLVKMTRRGQEQIRTAEGGTTLLNPCTIPNAPFVLNLVGLKQKNYDTKELYAGGLSMGPCYYYPWDRLLGWVWAQDLQPPYIQVIDGPTAIGEFCTGGSIALGLTRTLMYGWGLGQSPHAGKDAISVVEMVPTDPCSNTAFVTIIPLDGAGATLPPGQDVTLVADPPYIEDASMESFTDPNTGVTEYRVEVKSGRCSKDPREIKFKVGSVELAHSVQVLFPCPPVAMDGIAFDAIPAQVPADGKSAAEVRIEAKDTCGNPAFGREVSLQVLGDAPAVLSSTNPITQDAPEDPLDGTGILEATSLQPGSMGLRATIEGLVVESSPNLVTFTSVTAQDGGAGSDGGSDGGIDADAHVDSGGRRETGSGSESGCGCRVPSDRGNPSVFALLLLLGFFRTARRDSRR